MDLRDDDVSLLGTKINYIDTYAVRAVTQATHNFATVRQTRDHIREVFGRGAQHLFSDGVGFWPQCQIRLYVSALSPFADITTLDASSARDKRGCSSFIPACTVSHQEHNSISWQCGCLIPTPFYWYCEWTWPVVMIVTAGVACAWY